LEKMYELLYMQKVRDESASKTKGGGSDERTRLRILPGTKVESVALREDRSIHISVKNMAVAGLTGEDGFGETNGYSGQDGFEYDLVILATGYSHDGYEKLLHPVREAAIAGNAGGALNAGEWSVGKDYKLSVRGLRISSHAGIWLQGCNEETHGVSPSFI
jgi:lysine/ornithine N-monooxygenase